MAKWAHDSGWLTSEARALMVNYDRAWKHPKPLRLCFENHRSDGKVWAIQVGKRWRRVKSLTVNNVTLETVYKGPKAKQPRAYLTGFGQVTITKGHAVVSR